MKANLLFSKYLKTQCLIFTYFGPLSFFFKKGRKRGGGKLFYILTLLKVYAYKNNALFLVTEMENKPIASKFRIQFCQEERLTSSGSTLECQKFALTLNNLPSDRHAYSAKLYINPIR